MSARTPRAALSALAALAAFAAFAALAAGCGSSTSTSPGSDAGPTPDAGNEGGLCAATTVDCAPDLITKLNYKSTVAPGEITNTVDGDGFKVHVDATAGGLTPTESYVYARFTDRGLEKVSLSDEAAIDSMDWDIAFRRYIVRINSGASGPSCVQAARMPASITYDGLSAMSGVPESATWHGDDYVNTDCSLIGDSGLPDSPAVTLSGFWEYGSGSPPCLKMTGAVYVVALRSGRHVKMSVTSYYDEAAQQQCETSGTVPMPSGSGNVRFRWQYLD